MNPSILNLDIKHHVSKVTFLKTAFSTNISLRHSSSALFAASSGPWGIIINHSSTHQTLNSATWSVLKWDLNQIRWGHRKSRRISRRSTKPPASLALLPPEIANFNYRVNLSCTITRADISAPDNVKAEVKTSRILRYQQSSKFNGPLQQGNGHPIVSFCPKTFTNLMRI